ncbi:hypothetical protein [Roseivirga sp.]|uniref:hypothetical protein n=1 Tax=Roseivirga sp. TaxID=1964215 RepID=UPI003B52ED6E
MKIRYSNLFFRYSFDGTLFKYEARSLLKLYARLMGGSYYIEVPVNAILYGSQRRGFPFSSLKLLIFYNNWGHDKLRASRVRKIPWLPKDMIELILEAVAGNIQSNLLGKNVMLMHVPLSEVDFFYRKIFSRELSKADVDESLVRVFTRFTSPKVNGCTPWLSAEG